jgi:hypothetical protein
LRIVVELSHLVGLNGFGKPRIPRRLGSSPVERKLMMQLKSMPRLRIAAGAVMVALVSAAGHAQSTDAPVGGPGENVERVLKLADPEIVELKKLDYSGVDLEATDIKTKTAAVMALNNFLAKHGERARKRVALLEDYIATRGLSEEFSQDAAVVPDASMPSLEDGLKLAVLVVQMPEGKAAADAQLRDAKPEMLNRIYASYYA